MRFRRQLAAACRLGHEVAVHAKDGERRLQVVKNLAPRIAHRRRTRGRALHRLPDGRGRIRCAGIPPGRRPTENDLDSDGRRGRPQKTQGERPRSGGRGRRKQDGEESQARVRGHEEEAPALARDRRLGRDEHDEDREEVARRAARFRERDEREAERHEKAQRRGERAQKPRSERGREEPTEDERGGRESHDGRHVGGHDGSRREQDEEGQGQEGRPEKARPSGSAQRRAAVQIDLETGARR